MDNYEAEAFISEKLSSKLKRDEKILWYGCTEEYTTPKERGYSVSRLILAIIWIIGCVLVTVVAFQEVGIGVMVGIFQIPFYILGIHLLTKYFKGSIEMYAVTNLKIYVLDKRGRVINGCFTIGQEVKQCCTEDRGIGFVTVGTSNTKYNITFRGIVNPKETVETVQNIINEANSQLKDDISKAEALLSSTRKMKDKIENDFLMKK